MVASPGIGSASRKIGRYWVSAGFYLKVAPVFIGAGSRDLVFRDQALAATAALAFVLSVHAYPAASWHTVDGILMAVFALYFC
ncbi:MAG: hypothetical protein R2792_19920 [Saprospiraceae bacterium]